MGGGGPSAVAASVIWRPRLLRSWLLRFNDLSQLSVAALFIFPTPHGRTVFSIESCGYCITFNLFHLPGDMIITGQTLNFLRTRPLHLASHSELARLKLMSWNFTLCILL